MEPLSDGQFPWDLERRPSSRFPVYTRGNVAEVFPNPVSPLEWTAVTVLATEPGWRDALTELGAFDRHEFAADPEVLNWFGGYLYLNLSVLRTFAVRAPGMTTEMMDAGLLGDHPDVPPHRTSVVDDSQVHAERLGETLARIVCTGAWPRAELDRQQVEAFAAGRPHLSACTPAELIARVHDAMLHVRPMMASHVVATMSASVAVGVVSTICAQVLGDATLVYDLISGLGDIDSAGPSYALWDVSRIASASAAVTAEFDRGVPGLLPRLRNLPEAAEFLRGFESAVARYPFRGPDEYNLVAATWETTPELALAAVDRMRIADVTADPTVRHAKLAARRAACTEGALVRLTGRPDQAGELEAGIRAAHVYLSAREAGRINLGIPIHEARLALRELGSRMVARGHLARWEDIEVLTLEELDVFVTDPVVFGETVNRRVEAFSRLCDLEPPFIVDGHVPPTAEWKLRERDQVAAAAAGSVLTGIGGCPGRITGTARVILDPLSPEGLNPGEILVAPLTDPAWTPLFVPAAAVVVDHGAVLSHAVIVSRELGIPCVVSVSDATRRIRDGATITVDGLAGSITIHD